MTDLSATSLILPCGVFDLAAPDSRKIRPRDIAKALSRTARWGGRSSRPVTVAMHILNGIGMASPEALPYWLLHDAHEAYIGDIPTPVKEAFQQASGTQCDPVQTVSLRLDHAILQAAGLKPPADKVQDEIKIIDHAMLNFERVHYGALGYPTGWAAVDLLDPQLIGVEPTTYNLRRNQVALLLALLDNCPNWRRTP